MALALLAESLTLIQIKSRRVLSGRRLFVPEVKLVARNAARRSGATSRGTECEGGNSLYHKWAERQLRAEGRANCCKKHRPSCDERSLCRHRDIRPRAPAILRP